jgi:hypothetical protein
MAGQTFGLRGLRCVTKILVPAAFPSVLSGHKIDSAFAWRTLIAAELVFRVSSQGNLGWFIFENSNLVDTAGVIVGLMTVTPGCSRSSSTSRCAAVAWSAEVSTDVDGDHVAPLYVPARSRPASAVRRMPARGATLP